MRINYFILLILFLLAGSFPCQSQVYFNVCITQAAPLQADAGNNKIACQGGVVIGGTPAGTGGTAGYTYSWTPSTHLSSASVSNPIASPIDTTTYTVTVTDSFGCSAMSSVSVFSNPLPVINAGLDDTIELGKSTQLNSSGALNCIWSPSNGLSCTNCLDPIAAPPETTSYYVTGNDEYGCTSSDTIIVFVTLKDETLYIPSSFSPNGNNINDLFYVYGSFIKTIDLQIFDRWGELVFQTNDIKRGWDGKFNDVNAEEGVYVYSLQCEWVSGIKTQRRGIVTLLR